jgi:hypothetical protein
LARRAIVGNMHRHIDAFAQRGAKHVCQRTEQRQQLHHSGHQPLAPRIGQQFASQSVTSLHLGEHERHEVATLPCDEVFRVHLTLCKEGCESFCAVQLLVSSVSRWSFDSNSSAHTRPFAVWQASWMHARCMFANARSARPTHRRQPSRSSRASPTSPAGPGLKYYPATRGKAPSPRSCPGACGARSPSASGLAPHPRSRPATPSARETVRQPGEAHGVDESISSPRHIGGCSVDRGEGQVEVTPIGLPPALRR